MMLVLFSVDNSKKKPWSENQGMKFAIWEERGI